MIWRRVDYHLVALFKHTAATEVQSDGGKVGENRVRKPYGWDGIELETRKESQKAMVMA
jgi:hypothetical protein